MWYTYAIDEPPWLLKTIFTFGTIVEAQIIDKSQLFASSNPIPGTYLFHHYICSLSSLPLTFYPIVIGTITIKTSYRSSYLDLIPRTCPLTDQFSSQDGMGAVSLFLFKVHTKSCFKPSQSITPLLYQPFPIEWRQISSYGSQEDCFRLQKVVRIVIFLKIPKSTPCEAAKSSKKTSKHQKEVTIRWNKRTSVSATLKFRNSRGSMEAIGTSQQEQQGFHPLQGHSLHLPLHPPYYQGSGTLFRRVRINIPCMIHTFSACLYLQKVQSPLQKRLSFSLHTAKYSNTSDH